MIFASAVLMTACSPGAPPSASTPTATAAAAAVPPLPEGLALDGPCPDVGAAAADEDARSAVPLAVGLTLANVWNVNADDPDRECLTQVKEVDATSVTVTSTCPSNVDRQIITWTRRICRSDLRGAYLYHPSTRTSNPAIIGGTTMFSLSSRALRELKANGRTRHRFIYVASYWQNRPDKLDEDRDGALGSPREGTASVIVNDRVVELPVLKVTGTVGGQLVKASVLNDERLPLVLDYVWPSGFSVHYTKISYPGRVIEQQLETEKRVDVYGIYFDFARDVPRVESEPVLREIADLLVMHPDWKLAINGHTDNVGGTEANLDLSRRRSDAVRRALIERYGIGGERLTTAGFGAAQPKATNDTIEGRAKNRRVELVRQ